MMNYLTVNSGLLHLLISTLFSKEALLGLVINALSAGLLNIEL